MHSTVLKGKKAQGLGHWFGAIAKWIKTHIGITAVSKGADDSSLSDISAHQNLQDQALRFRVRLPFIVLMSFLLGWVGTANAAPSSASLSLNTASYATNSVLQLSVAATAGVPAAAVDAYIYLKLPDGSLLYMQADGGFSVNSVPMFPNVVVPTLSSTPIFNYQFSGAEPVGTYTWYVAMKQPGTTNVIGTIASVNFSFTSISSPTLTISGIVTDDPITNATVDLYSIGGVLMTSGTTDASGSFTITGFDPAVTAQGYELVATGGLLLGVPFTGEMRAIYGPQDNQSQANITLITTLVAGLARDNLTAPTLMAKRDAAIQQIEGIGMVQAGEWSQIAPISVDTQGLRSRVRQLGIAAWQNQLSVDLADGDLSVQSMDGFPNAHGGLRAVNVANRLEVMSDEVLSSPLALTGLPNATYTKQLLSGPPSMSIDANGVLTFIPPVGSAGGSSIPFTVRVTNTASGFYRDLVANVYVMTVDTLISATTDALGGRYYSPWRDAFIDVPAGATTGTATVKLLRATRLDGSYLYKMTSSVSLTGATYTTPNPAVRALQLSSSVTPPLLRSRQSVTVRERTPANGWTLVGDEFFSSYWEVPRCLINSVNRAPYGASGRPAGIIAYGAKKSAALYHYTPVATNAANNNPVLLVNGFTLSGQGTFVGIGELGGGEGTWGHTGEMIAGLGYDVFEFNWRTNARFKDAANDLAMAINRVHRLTGKKVHIIAHSFGGVLSRTYLQGLASGTPYRNDVASLMTLGTPHSGISDASQTVNFIDANGMTITTTLPRGRDDIGIIATSGQLSVYNAGHLNRNAFHKGVWTRSLLDPIGICTPTGTNYIPDFEQIPAGAQIPVGGTQTPAGRWIPPAGMLIAKLSHTELYPLPSDVPVKVMIGLTYKYSTSVSSSIGIPAYIIDNGDGLISYAGQRFSPTFGNTPTVDGLNFPLTGFVGASQVMEENLGLYHTAVPGGGLTLNINKMSQYLQDHTSPNPSVGADDLGYRHTSNAALGGSGRGNISEVNIADADVDNDSFVAMENWLGSGVAAWVSARSVTPVPVTPAQNIPVHVRVFDGATPQPHSPLQNAHVGFYLDSNSITPEVGGVTDALGHFNATVPFRANATYTAIATNISTGLSATATIVMRDTLESSPGEFGGVVLLTGVDTLVPPTPLQLGNLSGTITDAVLGGGVAGVAYQIFNDASPSATAERSGVTNASGFYSEMGLITGGYTIKLSKTGYIDNTSTVFVQGSTNNLGNSGMSPVLQTGQMRIRLDWGLNPRDLDSHLVKYDAAGAQQYHIYYGARTGAGGDSLDQDIQSSYGPETVTIQAVDPAARYVYAVHHWGGTGSIPTTSNATVNISYGVNSSQVLNAPTTGVGRYWKVFELVNGQVIPCNSGCMLPDVATATRALTVRPNWLTVMQRGMVAK